MKAHSRITAQIIRDQYEKKFQQTERWVLKHESKVLYNLQSTLGELDSYNDKVVAFEAVKASDSGRMVSSRQPLQPKNSQPLSPPVEQPRHGLNGIQNIKPPPFEAPASRGPEDAHHPTAHNPLSPQAMANELLAGPPPPPHTDLSDGFARFQTSLIDRLRTSQQGSSESQIQDSIRRYWIALSPEARASTCSKRSDSCISYHCQRGNIDHTDTMFSTPINISIYSL